MCAQPNSLEIVLWKVVMHSKVSHIVHGNFSLLKTPKKAGIKAPLKHSLKQAMKQLIEHL